jgi:hypothetical protein
MCADLHPALSEGYNDVPGLTLVLPGDLGKDEVLTDVVKAIGQVRTQIAACALQFRKRAETYAAGGDVLRQALCRGQALGAEHAVAGGRRALCALSANEQVGSRIAAMRQSVVGKQNARQRIHSVTVVTRLAARNRLDLCDAAAQAGYEAGEK